MEHLEQRIERIEARNEKVEADKAWETSATRRALLALFTPLERRRPLSAVAGIS